MPICADVYGGGRIVVGIGEVDIQKGQTRVRDDNL
jgi:hypothetical protein